MKKELAIIVVTMALLPAMPALSSGEQFKITKVYDGNTVRAEGYDTDCLP